LYNITQTIKNQPTMGGLTVVGVGIMAAGVIDAIRRLRTGEKRSLLTVIETHSEQAYEKIRNIAAKIEETD
jgi:hypothetical protein